MDQSTKSTRTDLLAPPERARLDEQIADTLTNAIVDGHYQPGSLLPPERELAARLGVNRTSLRQALARLEQMGLIETQQGTGNVVGDPTGLADPSVVEAVVRRLGPEFLGELLEVRETLGAQIGRLAADRSEPADIEALRRAEEVVRQAGSPAECQEADLAYFRCLTRAGRNRALELLVRWVEKVYGGRTHELTAAFADPVGIAETLARITAAVERHDVEASEAAVVSYFADSALRMLQSFESAQSVE